MAHGFVFKQVLNEVAIALKVLTTSSLVPQCCTLYVYMYAKTERSYVRHVALSEREHMVLAALVMWYSHRSCDSHVSSHQYDTGGVGGQRNGLQLNDIRMFQFPTWNQTQGNWHCQKFCEIFLIYSHNNQKCRNCSAYGRSSSSRSKLSRAFSPQSGLSVFITTGSSSSRNPPNTSPYLQLPRAVVNLSIENGTSHPRIVPTRFLAAIMSFFLETRFGIWVLSRT